MNTKKLSNQQRSELNNIINKFNQITKVLNSTKENGIEQADDHFSTLSNLALRAKKLGAASVTQLIQQINLSDELNTYLRDRNLPVHSLIEMMAGIGEDIANKTARIETFAPISLATILDYHFDNFRSKRLSLSRKNSQLVYEDFRNILLGNFYDNVHFLSPNEMLFDSSDISIIKTLNESLAWLKSEAKKRYTNFRGDVFALFKDKEGFGINMVLLPKNPSVPFANHFGIGIKDVLDKKFQTTFYQDPNRIRYTVRFNKDISEKLLQREIARFGIEVINDYCGPNDPITLWFDTNKEFDKDGIYALI